MTMRSMFFAGSTLVGLVPALGTTQTLDPGKTGMVMMFQDTASRLTAEAKQSIETVLRNCVNCDSEIRSEARNAISELTEVLNNLDNLKYMTSEVIDSCNRIIKICREK
jgi:hypothetical protein